MRRSGRPTIRDVAEQAGVGIATVDRVLNRRAPVSESATRQVLEAARAIGYHAASLVQQRLQERLGERRLGFLLQRRFTFIGVDAYLQDIVKGIIIVAAVTADQYRQRRRKKV